LSDPDATIVVLRENPPFYDAPTLDYYQYKPLVSSEIRLIKILPGKALAFELLHCSLTDAPPYCALSYTWGAEGGCDTIRLDDRRFSLTKNLFQALCHLAPRVRSLGFLLWVDAICINQEDIEERSQQVVLMREIYQQARVIKIWLGAPLEHKLNTLAFIKILELGELMAEVLIGDDKDHSIDKLEALISRPGVFPVVDGRINDPVINAIFCILGQPWWQRAWIIQESTCEPLTIVFCGQIGIALKRFDLLIHFLGMAVSVTNFSEEDSGLANVATVNSVRTRYNFGSNLGLLETLDYFRQSKCKDPRDKVYAALSVTQTKEPKIIPNYHKSLNDVYLDVVQSSLTRNGHEDTRLDFLSYVERSRDMALGDGISLPTWMPDWRMQSESSLMGTRRRRHPNRPSSSDLEAFGLSWAPYIIPKVNELIVRGWVVDFVDMHFYEARSAINAGVDVTIIDR
jgi:hypothetical protein